MVALVTGVVENTEEEETSRDGGVQNAKEDQGRDHERERHLLVDIVANSPKGRSRHVLIAGVDIDNGADDAEGEDLGDSHGRHGFPKVTGLFHFRNETRECNLTDERVTDVQKGIDGGHE